MQAVLVLGVMWLWMVDEDELPRTWRHQFWAAGPVDPVKVAASLRGSFELPADEAIYVGPLEGAPVDSEVPRVRVLTRQVGGEFPVLLEVVAVPALAYDHEGLEPSEVGVDLADVTGRRIVFPDETFDRSAWVLVVPDQEDLIPVVVSRRLLHRNQLKVIKERPLVPVPVEAGQPVKPPHRAVPSQSVLAARDYLSDQMMQVAKMARPGARRLMLRQGAIAMSDWHPLGRHRYNCLVVVEIVQAGLGWQAADIVRAATDAFIQLGWETREPEHNPHASRGGAGRDGYYVGFSMITREGRLDLRGSTPHFRLRPWDNDSESTKDRWVDL